jgi:hypothetical protein
MLKQNLTTALLLWARGTTAPADNFEIQLKIFVWKLRSEKLLRFLQVCSSQIDS